MMRLQARLLPKWLIISLLVVALLGFADATYLTIEHYANKIPPCTISGCETVLTSAYSSVLGIPDALLGSLFYIFLIILLLLYLDTKKEIFLRIATLSTTIGFLVSVYLFVLQAWVIHSFCQYCLFSATTSTILFGISLYIFCNYRDKGMPEKPVL